MTRSRAIYLALVAAAFATAVMSIARAEECPTTLSYLANRLPRYNNERLERMRNAVIHENVAEDMKRAIAQGMTPAQAAAYLLQAAVKVKAQQPNVEKCIREIGNDPERMMGELRGGNYRFSDNPTSAVEACAAQYVLNYYMVVATKESALVGACLARRSP
jgi:hypothetical protein